MIQDKTQENQGQTLGRTPIHLTPENRPYLDALVRCVAFSGQRDADAEDVLLKAIEDLIAYRGVVTDLAQLGVTT